MGAWSRVGELGFSFFMLWNKNLKGQEEKQYKS
jgi:hypothetical protein